MLMSIRNYSYATAVCESSFAFMTETDANHMHINHINNTLHSTGTSNV